MSTTTIMVAPIDVPDGALFGYGVNQLTGDRIGITALADLPDPVIQVPSDYGEQLHALIVQDSESYSDLMSTVADISASGVSWSASASVSFLREQASSDTAITFTWTRVARTQNRIVDWTKATVTQDALDTLNNSGVDTFIAKYGTHCVVGIAYGASFSGYAQIQTESISDKEALKTAIKGSVSGFGVSGSVSASFQNDLNSAQVTSSSSQDTKVVGASSAVPKHFDIAAMQAAVEAFAPDPNSSVTGVSGAPVALICVGWDQFAAISSALGTKVNTISLIAEQATLAALSKEYSDLTYISGTASDLQGAPSVIPAYGPTLVRIAAQADAARQTIARLSLKDVRDYARNGTANFVIASTLKPQTDGIGRGYGQLQINYTLDWAFNNANSTFTVRKVPGDGEVNLGQFNHYRAEGTPDGNQILSLLYTFDRDASGTPFIAARMHFQDPYAPEESQQQDWPSARLLLNQSSNLSVTAAWPEYSYNQITVTLVPPTSA